MSETPDAVPATAETSFDLRPLLFSTMAGTMAMMAFVSLVGPIARVLGLQAWQAGAAVTVSGVLWLLLARPWGNASDRVGRRRVLLLGSAGVTLSYVLLAVFVDTALRLQPVAALSFLGLLLGRGAVGAFYAALPAAGQALIADNYPPRQRAAALASLGAANAVGMVLGPAIAALLARHSLSLPLYAMSVLPLLGFGVLYARLQRQEHHLQRVAQSIRLGDARLRRPMLVAFVAMFCVAVAQITVGFFALDRLGLAPGEAAQAAGVALTTVGVALILAQLLVRRLDWAPQRLIRVGALVAGIGFAGTCLALQAWQLWLAFFVAAAGMGWVFPAFSALAANAVNADEQGSTAGSMGAAQGLGVVLGPLAGSLLYGLEPRLPYLLVGALLVLVAAWPEGARAPAAAA
ncbi:Predicted arabinose efflux permease, MFS family [Pseudomonas delhiensis]|uniref:Predicted arabinose efflux permease, MFS family n=2 Tax=Pseudomonas TaxID=286 RepID=A0A239MK24_9PSED|nr:MFS transporter [Pseudomonas delhiensis]SDI21671.1 Predicted arabinose efflux permease, MFS family [Pseudomonas delhiensis]SNT43015.1 Predicted arabinose efflux permease, MFS family [Pseudomonas delhiensis]